VIIQENILGWQEEKSLFFGIPRKSVERSAAGQSPVKAAPLKTNGETESRRQPFCEGL